MNDFASLLGWLAAAAVLMVFVHRRRKRKKPMLLAADPALSAKYVAFGQDYAYLQKQAANIRQLKNDALSSRDEIDSFVEELELRQYLEDATAFIAETRAAGSPELLEMAEYVQDLLRSLGVNAEELDRAIRHHIDKAKIARPGVNRDGL